MQNHNNKPLYQTKGDPNKGFTSRVNVRDDSCYGRPEVIYKNLILYCELYKDPEDGSLSVHIACPKCGNNLIIDQKKKALHWDEQRNVLDVEPFMCTWEAISDRRIEFGIGLCKWRVGIKNNIALDS